MDFRPEFDDFEVAGMSLRLDNGSYRSLNGGVPQGAVGWRSLVDYLELEIGYAQYLQRDNSDPTRAEAIYGYRCVHEQPHWLLVALATSELYDKVSDEPEQSGWGYELTMRFASESEEPPQEAISILNAVVEYVAVYQAPLAANHTLDLEGLLEETPAEGLGFLALRRDPMFGQVLTPNGEVDFLQVVVATEAEMAAMFDWNNREVLELMKQSTSDLLIASRDRTCIMGNPETAKFVEDKIATEGSSGALLFAAELVEWRNGRGEAKDKLILSEELVTSFVRRLKGRLLFERTLQVFGEDLELCMFPAEHSSLSVHHETVELHLSAPAIQSLISVLESGERKFSCPEIPQLIIQLRSTDLDEID